MASHRKLKSALIFSIACLYLASSFIENHFLHYLLTALSAVTVVICLFDAGGMNRTIGILLFGVGSAILFYYQAPGVVWIDSMHANGNLIALIILVQMLGIPLKFERYIKVLERARNFLSGRGIRELYRGSYGLSHSLAVILNFACIPISYQVLGSGGNSAVVQRTMLTAISRGYVTSSIWSPNTSIMALVLMWGSSWLGVLLPGLVLALIALPVGWWLEKTRLRKENIDYLYSCLNNHESLLAEPGNKNYTGQFVSIISVFLAGVILLDQYTVFGIITIIPALSLLVPPLWAKGTGEWESYVTGLKGYFADRLAVMDNEIIIFLGAGFFAAAIGYSPIKHALIAVFSHVAGFPAALSLTIISLVVVLSVAGCHPILVISAMVSTLTPELMRCSPQFLALTVLIAWALALIISPFSVTSLSVAALVRKSSVEVGVKWHLVFVLAMLVISVMYLSLLNKVFGY